MSVLLTATDVAERLNVSKDTVLRWVRQGRLPAFRLPSGALRFREDALSDWLAARATEGEGRSPQESDKPSLVEAPLGR